MTTPRPSALLALTFACVLTASACTAGEPTAEADPARVRPAALAVPGAADLPIAQDHAQGHAEDPSGDATVANLDPDLLRAFRDAVRDAREDGVEISLTSGWRSRAHQQRLFDEAVGRYGSEKEALRWVATPDTSEHVTGDAVDLGPREAQDWLVTHGAAYGLCQLYANEPWHFELATEPGGECPDLLPDGSWAG